MVLSVLARLELSATQPFKMILHILHTSNNEEPQLATDIVRRGSNDVRALKQPRLMWWMYCVTRFL
jgi:hypothetical protein